MAELIAASSALGAASSLITFADVAWRVLKRLEEYCDRTKDAPKVIKNIRPQLRILAEKLEELKQGERDVSLATNSSSALSKVIGPFKEQIDFLDQLTAKMLPAKSDSTRLRLRKAALSIYYEKELSRVWAQLETYKTTLIFHFTHMAVPPVLVLEAKPPKTHYHYPASVVSHLVTRETPLSKIEDIFSNPALAANSRVVILLGMGGCGKTQLALQYCRESEAKGRFSSIFWFDASSPTAIAQSFSSTAGTITGNKADPKDFEANIQIVKGSLGTWTDRWLLVFDNFDDPKAFEGRDIKEYFPHSENGAILFTSRHGDVKRLGQVISINEMSQSEGLELLFRQVRCDRNESNRLVGKQIITRLGNLALAIDQAGAYISARSLPLHLFIDHYNMRREKVLKETPSTLWEYRRKLNDVEEETSLSVFTTWEMSFEQIDKAEANGKTLEHLLTLSAFFNNINIFEDLFKRHYESEKPEWMEIFGCGGAWDSFEFQDMLAQLAKLSLISSLEITATGAYFSLHPLIQDWIKLRLNIQDCRKMTTEAISILANYAAGLDYNRFTFSLRQIILSHLTASVQNEVNFLDYNEGFESTTLLRTAYSFALFFYGQGRLAAAEALYNRALAGTEKTLGRNHILMFEIFNGLGILYSDQGRLAESEAMYNQVLAGLEALGQDHILIPQVASNLGVLYYAQGRLVEAEAMYNRAQAGLEKMLGQDHTSTLRVVNNLVILYYAQGRLVEAEIMFNRAQAGYEKMLGQDHSLTLQVVNDLGTLYHAQDRLVEAEIMFNRAQAGYEKMLGQDHSLTLQVVNDLGTLYHAQDRLVEAEIMYNRAQAGLEKILGLEHPSTLVIINNLASLYRVQGRLDEAEAMLNRALAGFEALGQDRTSIFHVASNLGVLYSAQGRLVEAEIMFNRAQAGYEKMLGLDHTLTRSAIKNLGILYRDQGRLDEAEAMFSRLSISKNNSAGQDIQSHRARVPLLRKFFFCS